MRKTISIIKQIVLSGKLLLFFLPIMMLGTIVLFIESIKPTSAYIEQAAPIALFCSVIICLWMWLFWINAYRTGAFDNTGKIKGKKDKFMDKIAVILLPLLFAFMAYNAILYGIPMLLHPISSPEPIQISVHVTEKEIYSTRRQFTCRYRIHFYHEDIPEKNYLCASKSIWEQVSENDTLIVSASKSTYSYYIRKIKHI